MQDLTPRQSEILELLRTHLSETGFPPTRAEIAAHFGFSSPNAAEEHLRALERKGAIEMLPGASRGLRILQPEGLPVVGRVAAGAPILAEQHIEAHSRIEASVFKPRAHYFLRVRGLSMRDAGILEGDLLAVHRSSEARTGQVVVARVNDEVTVKRLKRRGHQIQLLPENPDFAPIEVDARKDQLVIEGIGVGIVRNGRSL
jgi:repressor LexA